ncbi:MAG: hypothetical protein R3F34_03720 [Planctomycetota bacterium]
MRSTTILLALLAFLPSCGGGSNDGGQAATHADDHADHDHGAEDHADHDHAHDHADLGDPVTVHEGAMGDFADVHVTWFRPRTTPVEELAFEIEAEGVSIVRGEVIDATGAKSLRASAKAENGSDFDLHVGELPAGIESGATLSLELEGPDGTKATAVIRLIP